MMNSEICALFDELQFSVFSCILYALRLSSSSSGGSSSSSSSVVSWTQVVDLCVQSIVRNNFQSQNKIGINQSIVNSTLLRPR